MTDDLPAGLAERVSAARGEVIALDLPPWQIQDLVYHLWNTLDEDVRLVLGRACTTAAKAGDQLVAALQLPYGAARGWSDLIDAFGEGSVSEQRCVVVADASELLKYEDPDLWRDLMWAMRSGPHCLGGGWTTVVLVDNEYAWESSAFGTAAAAEAAARR